MTYTKIDAILEKKKQLDAEIREFGKEGFSEIAQDVLAKLPEWITGIQWCQYTPYFNDGEPCTFSVGEIGVDFEGCDDHWDSVCEAAERMTGEIEGNRWEDPNYEKNLTELRQAIKPMVTIPDEVFEIVFGDHAQVTISRDGTVEVDDYDHD